MLSYTVLDNLPIAVVITNRDAKILFVNKKFTAISGYSLSEIEGKKIGKDGILYSGEHSDEFYKSMWKILKNGEVFEGTIKNKSKHGSLYWQHVTIIPYEEEQVYLGYITSIFKTDEIAEYLQIFNTLIENLNGFIYVYNFEKEEFTFISKSVIDFLGLSKDELVRLRKNFIKYFYDEDKKIFNNYSSINKLADRENSSIIFRIINSKNYFNYFQGVEFVYKRNEDGNVIEKIGIVYSIDETRDKNLLLHAIFESSSETHLIWDSNRKIIRILPEDRKNLPIFNELLGKTFYEIKTINLLYDGIERLNNLFELVLEDSTKSYTDVLHLESNNTVYSLELVMSRFNTDKFYSAVRDITKIHKGQEKLKTLDEVLKDFTTTFMEINKENSDV